MWGDDCGPGYLDLQVKQASLFERVVGIDASAEQLQHAAKRPNIEYRQGTGEATGLPPQSVDLVTAAAALHWFDVPATYREARRVLKPAGALAFFTFTGMQERFVPDNPAAERVRQELRDRFWPFMHPRLQSLFEHMYEGYEPSSTDFREAKRVQVDMFHEMSVAQMAGWARTWSAFLPYSKHHGEAAAERVLQRFERDMVAALGVPDPHTPVHMVWPIDVVLACQPVPLRE